MSRPTPPVVGVTADRRGDDQAVMLGRLGFHVLRGPALGTDLAPDDEALRQVTDDVIDRPPDFVVADTGIGIRTWIAAADSWGRGPELLAALGRSRIAARGPKAVGALRRAGLEVWWRAPSEQLAAVIDHLLAEGVSGHRVAVQLHGVDDPGTVATLQEAGAEVVTVPVYRWTVPADRRPALDLIERVIAGDVDAVTFTSAPAVSGFVGLARQVGLGEDLIAAFNGGVLVACVGPVCAEAARAEGISDPRYPEHWRLASLVGLVADALAGRPTGVTR